MHCYNILRLLTAQRVYKKKKEEQNLHMVINIIKVGGAHCPIQAQFMTTIRIRLAGLNSLCPTVVLLVLLLFHIYTMYFDDHFELSYYNNSRYAN